MEVPPHQRGGNAPKETEIKKIIYYEIEKFEGPEENFYTVSLTGATFGAKEIIKGLGMFQFNDPVGREKAWRTEAYLESELPTKKDEIRNIVTKMYNTLKEEGYSVVKI